MESRPVHVGILAMEVYVPANMVHVEDLEAVDGCVGKYTKGLEQVALSFATECEDVVSIALTCMHSLLDKHNVDPRRLGRLEVGSESNPDRCKSIKSHLMRLVGSAGNHDIEGVDSVHGCYGATAALFNAINWVESSSWDGRYAVVVAADVSSYAPGSASRATGGAGAVAMLIGPNAPLVADPAWRASYCDNSNEFCKPADAGPVPTFNGNATIQQFLKAVDCTYIYLFRRLQRLHARMLDMGALATPFDVSQGILPLVHHYLSHSPYARLVRKAFARLALQDAVRTPQGDGMLAAAGVPARWRVCAPDALPGAGYEDKALETAMLNATSNSYNIKVLPGASTQKQVGNAYAASLYLGLAGLWEAQGAQLQGRRLLLFSFGSGTMATLFALVGRAVGGDAGAFTLQGVADKMRLGAMLRERTRTSPASYDAVLQQMQQQWGRVPRSLSTELATTSCHQRIWLLTHVDEHHVRTYDRHGGTPRGRQQQSPQSQQTQMTWP